MITEEIYNQYITDFNAACAGDGNGFGEFYEKYFEPDATFEYMPKATKNSGKDVTVAFWQHVHELMHEKIQEHTSFAFSENKIAVEAPIDFLCKQDLEWVGEKHKEGTSFRLMMCAFYTVSKNNKFEYVRVYSIYHHDYQRG